MSNLQLTQNLRRLRNDYGYTQAQLSAKLNISRQAYSNYETGKRIPDLDILVTIANIYSVSLEQLLTQPCTKNGIIHEITGPFVPGLVADSDSALYLSKEEADLILCYRNADEAERKLTKKLLNI